MLGGDTIELLESGCGLLVALVSDRGAPLACRGWGLTMLDHGAHGRVLVDPLDLEALGRDDGVIGSALALTGAHIRSLRSVQVKGPITAIEPVTEADRVTADRYCDAFFDAVAEVDQIPRRLMQRLVPSTLVACTFDVTEVYDQTPGPGAGRPVAAARD